MGRARLRSVTRPSVCITSSLDFCALGLRADASILRSGTFHAALLEYKLTAPVRLIYSARRLMRMTHWLSVAMLGLALPVGPVAEPVRCDFSQYKPSRGLTAAIAED